MMEPGKLEWYLFIILDQVLLFICPPPPPLSLSFFLQRQGSGKFICRLEGNYEGSWDRDLKHGKGIMKYRNGDKYDGFWEFNKVISYDKYLYFCLFNS